MVDDPNILPKGVSRDDFGTDGDARIAAMIIDNQVCDSG
jgi:hypothetical protein